jgi:peroxiredoxin Q/BCP
MYTKLLITLALLVAFSAVALAQQPAPPKTHLKVGDAAPDFTLRATDGKTYKLSDFKGKKNVVLAIYVLAFTGG